MVKRHGKTSIKEKDPLEALKVIDSLEVGPAAVEKDRISAEYTVRRGGKSDSMDLVYRYEEPVFESSEPQSMNLAQMIASQVALNYGLFCRKIVFNGLYDGTDREFIVNMAKNTAREIYVKKLLEPNPFITGPASNLPHVKRKHYLQAEIVFSEGKSKFPGEWNADRSRYAVLSSGGKDSLLSFGLLDEMGYEVHPIFINESGRHWFTALNAHRHFGKTYPSTSKVWTNADRIFSWMLRQIPFVRKNFGNVRSDEYPLRLWTVAVFLFGALPLVRKRNIGRIIIGDEYDTTARMYHKGITHYNGLYDQSRYFDNALTRYYGRKMWGVSQFSILRPASELLIEKTLVERYPHLQRHQVSCHATHIQGKRVRPCGRCEKCRRIIGMLLAFGANPGNCGYTKKQVKAALLDLERKGVHQEKPGAEHLAFLLYGKRHIGTPRLGEDRAIEHTEIMHLRFDRERSPPNTVPGDIRKRLFEMLLEHADGAVVRSGRLWLEVDIMNDPDFSRPYLFESPGGASEPTGKTDFTRPSTGNHVLGELTWPQARRRFNEVDVALLPVGSIEQHGPHLPLDTDAFDAEYLAREVAAHCNDPKPLVLPLVPYGVSYHHEDFSGTISISPDTLARLVYEIGMNIAKQGITKFVIINGHGGNTPALRFAAQMVNRDAHIFTTVETGETSDAEISDIAETASDVHSGEVETSTGLATRPHLVHMDEAREFKTSFSSRYLDFSSKKSVEWYARTAKISPTGVMGNPKKASSEKGKRIWSVMIKNLVEFIEELKGMSLDEIYQRRY